MSSVHELLTQRVCGEGPIDYVTQLCDWTSSVLVSLQEVHDGPQDALPVNDVYFWRSQQDHLSRLCSWANSAAVANTVQECGEADVVKKWNQVIKQLQQAERETSWNYKYLSVVLTALQTLSADDASLPHFGPFINSLTYTHGASMYLKDHRMIPLLRKVVKRVEIKALSTFPNFQDIPRLSAAALAEKRRQALNYEEAFRQLSAGPGLVQDSRPQSAHTSWILAAARTTSMMCKHGSMVCARYAEILNAMENVGARSFHGRGLELAPLQVEALFDISRKTEVTNAFASALHSIKNAGTPEIESEEEVEENDDWVEETVGDAEVLRLANFNVPICL